MDYHKLFALMKARGLTTYRIRKENIISQSTLQKLREGKSVTTDAIATLCGVLRCQPGDMMEYEGRVTRLGDARPAEQKQTVPVPILGEIAAGVPIEAIDNFEGYLDYLPPNGRQDSNLFALRVKGTSMIDAGIYDGDLVVVRQTTFAENGQIVAAMVGGEATVKRFYKEKGHFRLQPENPAMEPIIVPEVEILGRVVSSVRYY